MNKEELIQNIYEYRTIPSLIQNLNVSRYKLIKLFDNYDISIDDFISKEEQNQIKQEQKRKTCLFRYGVEHPSQSVEIKRKKEQTNLKNSGFKHNWSGTKATRKRKQTFLENYGVTNPSLVPSIQQKKLETISKKSIEKKIISREKRQKTNLDIYGAINVSQVEKIKQKKVKTLLKKYGVNHNWLLPTSLESKKKRYASKDWHKKVYATKKRNNTFNSSKIETLIYYLLLEKFNIVERQYKESRYPFACDFYIKELDLFIELNFHWTHGGEPFDINNEEHLTRVSNLQNKDSKYYQIAIEVWTIRDIEKIRIAKENDLNYLAFYNIDQFTDWFESRGKVNGKIIS